MTINCGQFHRGSRVIPATKLQGNQNPAGKLGESSTLFRNQGMKLLAQGKYNAAKTEFLKMFDCTDLKAEDFAAVGKKMTDPAPGQSEIKADIFAKKFLKQAKELGSKDEVVHERLSQLYLHLYKSIPFIPALGKAETSARELAAINSRNTVAKDVLVDVYSSRFYVPMHGYDPEKASQFGKTLMKSSDPEIQKQGENIVDQRQYYAAHRSATKSIYFRDR